MKTIYNRERTARVTIRRTPKGYVLRLYTKKRKKSMPLPGPQRWAGTPIWSHANGCGWKLSGKGDNVTTQKTIDIPVFRPYPKGTLVAVTGVDPNHIRMIGRVVEDRGDEIKVESDDDIEADAAIEYDFPTLEHRCYVVKPAHVRLVIE